MYFSLPIVPSLQNFSINGNIIWNAHVVIAKGMWNPGKLGIQVEKHDSYNKAISGIQIWCWKLCFELWWWVLVGTAWPLLGLQISCLNPGKLGSQVQKHDSYNKAISGIQIWCWKLCSELWWWVLAGTTWALFGLQISCKCSAPSSTWHMQTQLFVLNVLWNNSWCMSETK